MTVKPEVGPKFLPKDRGTFLGAFVETRSGDFASAEKKEWWLLLSISSLGGAGYRSWIRDGGLTYFDLSTASADFEAWLWVHGWSVNDMRSEEHTSELQSLRHLV